MGFPVVAFVLEVCEISFGGESDIAQFSSCEE
jgi:hypothetical protein